MGYILNSVIKDITTLLHIKAFNFGWFGSWLIFLKFLKNYDFLMTLEKKTGKTLPGTRPLSGRPLLSSVVNLSMQYCSTFAVQAPNKTKLRGCICLYFTITFPVVVKWPWISFRSFRTKSLYITSPSLTPLADFALHFKCISISL